LPIEDREIATAPKPPTLDIDWLTEHLAIGGAFSTADAQRLVREHDITRVVDLRAEECDEELELRRHGIRLLHLPTPDRMAVAGRDLARGVAWVAKALAEKRRVLVHCQHGIGRSALLAACVLVASGMPPVEALLLAKNAREIVSPSPEQLQAFIAFVRRRRHRTAVWAVPTLDALGVIAWRHLQAASEAARKP
jgi:protein-tyrosine phosphatase